VNTVSEIPELWLQKWRLNLTSARKRVVGPFSADSANSHQGSLSEMSLSEMSLSEMSLSEMSLSEMSLSRITLSELSLSLIKMNKMIISRKKIIE